MTYPEAYRGEGAKAPRIYYEDEWVTLWHGDCRDVMASMPDRSFDAVLTDPPFDERTHAMARSSSKHAPAGGRALSGSRAAFVAFTHERQIETFAELGRLTRRWVVASLATSTAFRFDQEPPPGLRCLRVGAWIKTNPMPIFSADRPAQGWEPIVFLHRSDTKPAWGGGGRACNYVGPTAQGEDHPTAKPLPMISEWVRLFTSPGDLILDPFAGSGTVGRAAKDLGRRAILVEREERYCAVAAKRLAQDVLDFGALA